MKFTEAVQKCYENPGKTFENLGYLMIYDVKREALMFTTKDCYPDYFYGMSIEKLESDWQPVLQEVTWQEAIEAWLFEDKKVKWLWVSDENTAEKEYGIYDNSVPIRHIMNGKWYILED